MLDKIKAFFFDLDDTLINFGGVTKVAWELTCKNMIEKYPEMNIDYLVLAKTIYDINEALWSDEKNRPKGNVDFQKIRTEVVNEAWNYLELDDIEPKQFIIENYSKYKEESVYLLKNTYETLNELKRLGKKLVLITNGDAKRQRDKIKRFDLEKYFDAILIEGEQGFGKPDIRIYQKALDICNVLPHESCMVGDNYLWEVITPIKFGMKGVWMNFLSKDIEEDADILPDLIINDIQELLTLKDI